MTSSESIPTDSSLVWQSMESMLGSRRRSKKEISVLHWRFRNNCRIQATDRQYSFCLLILETKSIRILNILTWMYRVVHNTCIKHGRNIKTRYIGSILILQFGKDWHSIRLDRMQLSFKRHFQLIVFQKFLDWKLEKSFMRKHTCHLHLHQRSRYVTIGQKNPVLKRFMLILLTKNSVLQIEHGDLLKQR